MWWDFLEPTNNAPQEPQRAVISVVPVLRPVETKVLKEKVSGWFCGKCGRMVGSSITASEHEDEASHMTEILPKLYLGGAWNACNITELTMNNVGTILSMASELDKKIFPNTFRYKHIALEDDEREFALPMFISAAAFLRTNLNLNLNHMVTQIKQPDGILVHCAMGRSRSVSAVVAYLISSFPLTAHEAITFVRKLRPSANPNPGYVSQLLAIETLFRNIFENTLIAASYMSQNGLNH